MPNPGQFAPSFTAAKLYRKTSKNGQTYFTGRMGGVKVALLQSKETSDDGAEIWSLLFSEAAPYRPKEESSKVEPDTPHQLPASTASARGGRGPMALMKKSHSRNIGDNIVTQLPAYSTGNALLNFKPLNDAIDTNNENALADMSGTRKK